MTTSKDASAFAEAKLDTPLGAVCVKHRNYSQADFDLLHFGILVKPTVTCDMGRERGESAIAAIPDDAEVVIRGHAWSADEVFVHTLAGAEFKRDWEVD